MSCAVRLAHALVPCLLLAASLAPAPAAALTLRFAGSVSVVQNVTAEDNSLGPPDAALANMHGPEPTYPVPGDLILSDFGEEVAYGTAGLASLLGVSEALLLAADAIAVEVGRVPQGGTPDGYETSTHTFSDGAGSREVGNVYLGAFDPEIVARPTIFASEYDAFFGTTTPPPAEGIFTYSFLLFDFDAAPGDALDVLAPGFTWRVLGGDLSTGSPDPEFFAVVVPVPEPGSGALALLGLAGLVVLARRRAWAP